MKTDVGKFAVFSSAYPDIFRNCHLAAIYFSHSKIFCLTMVTVNWLRLLFGFTLDRLEHQELKLLHMVETTYHQSILITRCNDPVPLDALCAAIPRANTMKYQLQFVFYCVSYIECWKYRMSYCFVESDFRGSGHFILSYHLSVFSVHHCVFHFFINFSMSLH